MFGFWPIFPDNTQVKLGQILHRYPTEELFRIASVIFLQGAALLVTQSK